MNTRARIGDGEASTQPQTPGGVVEVHFRGGPLEGRRCIMCGPELRMHMALPEGQSLVYVQVRPDAVAVSTDGISVVQYVFVEDGQRDVSPPHRTEPRHAATPG